MVAPTTGYWLKPISRPIVNPKKENASISSTALMSKNTGLNFVFLSAQLNSFRIFQAKLAATTSK